MSDRVLVTGGAGFIGTRLVRRLLEGGRAVTVLDALAAAVHGEDAGPPPEIGGARFVRGDVRDETAWRTALEGVETVYHLAAETGTGESMYRARRYVDVNGGGTALLCDLLGTGAAPGVRRVVLASSRAVYGEGPYLCARDGVVHPPPRDAANLVAGRWDPRCPLCGGPIEPRPAGSDTPLRPTSTYGLTKRDQEELVRFLLPSRGVEVVTLRPQNVYGPGQSLRNPYTGILSIFSVRLLTGEEVRIFEDGAESRDFVFVDDVVEALVAANRVFVPDGGGLTFDVGSGRAVSVLEVARELATRYGADRGLIRVTGEYRLGDVRHAVADPGALGKVLGRWEPTPLERGLDALVEWVRGDGARPGSTLEKALAEMAESGLLGRAGGGGR